MSIGPTSHEWLFPRMQAVVHHAGAGTTAAGLRAGVPTISVPIFTDQPFWASRLTSLGAAGAPIPYKTLTPQLLAERITQTLATPRYGIQAQRIASVLATEDAVAPVLDALKRAASQP